MITRLFGQVATVSLSYYVKTTRQIKMAVLLASISKVRVSSKIIKLKHGPHIKWPADHFDFL